MEDILKEVSKNSARHHGGRESNLNLKYDLTQFAAAAAAASIVY